MIVDSSIWIEIILDGPLRKKCEELVAKMNHIVVPALVIFEVYKKIKVPGNEEASLEIVSALSQHEAMDINRDIALLAVDLSQEYDIGMADSLVLACAKIKKLELLTLDNDFSSIPGARVLRS